MAKYLVIFQIRSNYIGTHTKQDTIDCAPGELTKEIERYQNSFETKATSQAQGAWMAQYKTYDSNTHVSPWVVVSVVQVVPL